jgi:transposase
MDSHAPLTPSERQELNDLRVMVKVLLARVADLEAKLALNSRNSSKPPSSDWAPPKPAIPRKKGQNPTGGQKGHGGTTLRKADASQIDFIVEHPPSETNCSACGRFLPSAEDSGLPGRQVFDIPPIAKTISEHRVLRSICGCGQIHLGAFPAAVSAPVQYGPRAKAAAVFLSAHHMLPLSRISELMGELCGLPMSQASVLGALREAAQAVGPCVAQIAQACVASEVLHVDETGMRVGPKCSWLHAMGTLTLSWMGAHAQRGLGALNGLGWLASFRGVLVHDNWKPYRGLDCKHALCNAHQVRELAFVDEQLGQAWAKDYSGLLLATYEQVKAGGAMDDEKFAELMAKHRGLIARGRAINPKRVKEAKRSPNYARQAKAWNLVERLDKYADQTWRFARDGKVPFSNNIAERMMRMPKVKQKTSGCFRTFGGLSDFCEIRSYLDTMKKQGRWLYGALVSAFEGLVEQPMLAGAGSGCSTS